MKIVIACDSFKGSLSSQEAGDAVKAGILDAVEDAGVEVMAVADGGEGTAEVIVEALGGEMLSCEVRDPLGGCVKAHYGKIGELAVIEMAEASGLTLVPEEKRDPVLACGYGTGELIADALSRGCRKFLIGIGGSATNDAGVGMLRALGFEFYDSEGNITGITADTLGQITRIEAGKANPALLESEFRVACDVNNPLTGPNGATRIFGPQKGLESSQIPILDKAFKDFGKVVAEYAGVNYTDFPGAGAAGGMGFALISFLGAKLEKGIDLVLDAIDFNNRISDASLIITGEGRIDLQTRHDKAPYGILHRAKQRGIPVIAIGGSVEQAGREMLINQGVADVLQTMQPGQTIEEAMQPERAKQNIRKTIYKYFRDSIKSGKMPNA